jgi:hypothetical protein
MVYNYEKEVNIEQLDQEIRASSITVALDTITSLCLDVKITFKASISIAEKQVLDDIVAAHVPQPTPDDVLIARTINETFTSKNLVDGKKLFVRNHGYSHELAIGANDIEITIPYAHCKINELEVIGSEIGDKVNFKVLDSVNGDYTTIPKYQLNQFAFNLNLSKDHYRRHCSYDADLYLGMIILIEYDSKSAKDVGVNIVLHEVKD